jgi:peptidyl-prolyl isomerase E (cyclophilin E)
MYFFYEQPMDYVKGKHRGFVFVEFDDPDDAQEAIFNMDGAELLGRTIHVSMAQANQIHKLASSNASTEAIWKSDEWFQQYAGGHDEEATQAQLLKESDATTLKG